MEQEFKNILENVNGDPTRVANIIFELGLSHEDLQDHAKNGRVYEVLNYLLQHPNPSLLITKLTVNKPVENKLDHIWSYFKVKEQKEQVGTQLAKANSDFEEIAKVRGELQGKYEALDEQESYY